MKTENTTIDELLRRDDVQKINAAIDVLLDAMIEHDQNNNDYRGYVEQPSSHPIHSVAWWSDQKLPSRDESRVNAIVRNPIRGSCRLALIKLGERLHDIGGVGLMMEIGNRDRGNLTARKASIIDKAWDGIGRKDGKARWTA